MGAPNVYDTRYVNSGPGVGLSSSDTRHSSNTSLSKGSGAYSGYSSNGGSDLNKLVASVANAAQTQPAAQFIRDHYTNPSTSAYSADLFNEFMSNYGNSFDMDEYYDKIMDINEYNNTWSAAQAQRAMNFESNQAQKAMNFEASQAQKAMDFSAAQAQKQMDYQTVANKLAMNWSANEAYKSRQWTERLSNTAHQREVKDLLSAGLNPILAANNGAYAGSGATGQAFAGSGASGSSSMGHGSKGSGSMGQTDMSAASALTSMMSGVLSTARDIAITKINAQNSRYMTDMNYAAAKLAAGASIYNNNNTVSAQKAINALNRDADIKKASISASATRDSAAMSAGAITSAAATNAAAARYSAEQHAAASKYSSEQSRLASEYGSNKSYEARKYEVDNNWKSNPLGYIGSQTKILGDFLSDRDNVYTPDLGTWNTLGAE